METQYKTNNDNSVEFYDDPKGRYGCLCTFPYNYEICGKELDEETVASLALLGAAIAIDANTGGFDENTYHDNCTLDGHTRYVLPDCVPKWIRDEIKRVLGLSLDQE